MSQLPPRTLFGLVLLTSYIRNASLLYSRLFTEFSLYICNVPRFMYVTATTGWSCPRAFSFTFNDLQNLQDLQCEAIF